MSTPDSTAPAEPPLRTIALLAMAAFSSSVNMRVTDPLLAQVAHAFTTTVGTAAAIITGFTIGYGLLQLAFGPIGDRFGKYRVSGIMTIVAGLATASAALSDSLGDLTLARVAAGASCAAIIPLAFAWIGDAVTFERRQTVLARFLSAQFIGLVLGQALGGYIGAEFGWRTVFVLVGAMHVIAGVAMLTELHLNPTAQPAGAPRITGFVETFATARRILTRPFVRIMLIAVFLECFTMYGAFSYVGADLVHRLGVSFGTVGIILAFYGFGALSYSLNAKWLVPRLGERGLVLVGGSLVALAYLLLIVTPTLVLACVSTALMGLGFVMFHNTLQTNATQMAPEARGLAVSLFAFSLFIGQSIGVALAAPFVDKYGAPPIYLAAAILLPLIAIWFCKRLVIRGKI